ncbi:MAG: exodeoxyribonuclease V subunit gamma [Clostridia bacterium]|nr:exodeoxyribonuclease V subunit gamma [Clostridia bacterium]
MLRLILGTSKSGKTEYVRNYLSTLAKQGENKLLMIVPDQQSFETEKAFLELLGPQLSMNVTVLGFSRLCDFVFEKTDYIRGALADDCTKTLLMSIALEEVADSMRVYGDKAMSPQLLSMMLLLKKELVRSNSSSDALAGLALDKDDILSKKLYDVSLALSAYDALLSNSFDDPEGELSVACDLLREHKVFQDYTVCIDSYLSFTEPESDVVEQLLIQSRELFVTLSDDGLSTYDDSIFTVSRDTAKRLKACAKKNGVSVAVPLICSYKDYFTSRELTYIEENIFRSDDAISTIVENNNIHIYSASDKYDEADFVARNIRRLVIEQGYRYKDFAVVCRSVNPYMGILDTVLNRYGISFFMDSPSHVLSKPLMKLVSAIFKCITGSFNKDSVLAVLKSGITSADTVDIALFENYIFTWSLSGSKFLREFTANPRGFADEFTESDKEELEKIESVRKFLIEPLVNFRENIKSATSKEISQHLYSLLLSLGADEKIRSLCDELDASGEHTLSEEQLRLWEIFVETLDRTVAVIGDRRITPVRFSELLELQFSCHELAFIPRAMDQVTVGDIERLRLYDKKVVFVIGAVEGEFPATAPVSGLFTSHERDVLTEAGVLSDNSLELQSVRERYLCYYALTSASDKVFVSYPASTLTGTPVEPSVIITELMNIFENLAPEHSVLVPDAERLWAHKPSFSVYAKRFGSGDPLTSALDDYYSDNEIYRDSATSLTRAQSREPFKIKDKTIAERLFGTDMRLSASQVEKYHLCRFMYFCNYGLRLRERRTAQIDAMEYGSFVHYILEKFIGKYTKSQFCSLTDTEIATEVSTIMAAYAELHMGGMSDKSPRFNYLYHRVSVSAQMLINHLIKELSQSKFTPEAFELNIGKDVPAYTLSLPTGQTVTIRGFVDRADVYREGDKTYIRIVDYKTGSKVFSLSDIMYGLNLQMLIYLSALSRSGSVHFGGKLTPAGVLYMPAIAPVIDASFGTSEEKLSEKRDEKLRMNGLLLSDSDVLSAMENDLNGIYIPVSAKGETFKGSDNLATLEEFGAIFSKIDALIAEMATELSRGAVDATPAAGGYNACEYCPYSSVCGHKDTDPVRNIFKLDREEILEDLGLNNDTEEVAQ